MSPDLIVIIAVALVSLMSLYILISKDWRLCIAALAIQYIGVTLLVNASWPLEMSAVKVLAGWMACAILGVAMIYVPDTWPTSEKSILFGPLFRILAALLLALAITSLVVHSESWLSMIKLPLRWASFALIGMGLLQLSLTSHPLRVIIGLLTALSGFEIIYAAVESSALVTGLLAVVTLSLALAGAYLLIAPTMESNP
jgi:hypothetical protein